MSQGHRASFCEAHHISWFHLTSSLACKTKHFVQNKSQATKALKDRIKKGKLDKLIPNLQLIFKVYKNKAKTIDEFLSIIPSRTFVKNVIPIKRDCVTRNKM